MKQRIFFKISLVVIIGLIMLTTSTANTHVTDKASAILTDSQLTKMGYKTIKRLSYNGKMCDGYENAPTAIKTYQGIKSRHSMPQHKNTYYCLTDSSLSLLEPSNSKLKTSNKPSRMTISFQQYPYKIHSCQQQASFRINRV